jgi:hypothetical protein
MAKMAPAPVPTTSQEFRSLSVLRRLAGSTEALQGGFGHGELPGELDDQGLGAGAEPAGIEVRRVGRAWIEQNTRWPVEKRAPLRKGSAPGDIELTRISWHR